MKTNLLASTDLRLPRTKHKNLDHHSTNIENENITQSQRKAKDA